MPKQRTLVIYVLTFISVDSFPDVSEHDVTPGFCLDILHTKNRDVCFEFAEDASHVKLSKTVIISNDGKTGSDEEAAIREGRTCRLGKETIDDMLNDVDFLAEIYKRTKNNEKVACHQDYHGGLHIVIDSSTETADDLGVLIEVRKFYIKNKEARRTSNGLSMTPDEFGLAIALIIKAHPLLVKPSLFVIQSKRQKRRPVYKSKFGF